MIIFLLVITGVILFACGFVTGEIAGWVQCVNLGMKFVNTDGLLNKELIKSAIVHYRESLGGWMFDKKSPFFINNTNGTR